MRPSPCFTRAAIIGWARDLGSERLSSTALEEALAPLIRRLNLPRGILAQMTGINYRHLYPVDWPTHLGGLAAAKRLLTAFPDLTDRLELHFSTSVGRDFLEPSVASTVAAALGLGPKVKNLDLGSACLGFVDGLDLAARLIESQSLDYALVTAGENSRPLLENTLSRLLDPQTTVQDFFRHFASLTLGSGGAAMLVGPSQSHPTAPKILGAVSLADTTANDLCQGDFYGMTTDAGQLLTSGVALAAATFKEGQEAYGWTPEGFDAIICHQVSRANTDKLAEALELPPGRIFKTYPDYGNMGPVAAPFSFDLAWEKGILKSGQKTILMGIGSGLACSMLELAIP
ncbi:MAG: 3-oxoacyl-ACP synthase III [Deltaproteobacteria bacterium]|jgi:3-oxoacyl-[acyl-carrier-protein] synthase-3|nr:3-oxoacyl-ACP synthase III [Deltaproteobacteria bacterium]